MKLLGSTPNIGPIRKIHLFWASGLLLSLNTFAFGKAMVGGLLATQLFGLPITVGMIAGLGLLASLFWTGFMNHVRSF